MEVNQILHGNALTKLKELPDKSVHCCVTSPPYFSLRDYETGTWIGGNPECSHKPANTLKLRGIESSTLDGGKNHTGHKLEGFKDKCKHCGAIRIDQQIGLEETPEEFIEVLVRVFKEVKRVLRDDGTLWLNIGDSYWGGKGKSGQSYSSEAQQERYENGTSYNKAQHQIGGVGTTKPSDRKHPVIKPKDLIGIPWLLAFALRADGWYLRQDIIWHKTTSMPESVIDRCTKNHEYIFLLTKSAKYYYDHIAIMQDAKDSSVKRLSQDIENQKGSDRVPFKTNGAMKAVRSGNKERKNGSERGCPDGNGSNVCSNVPWEGIKANKRSVWSVTPRAFKESHFATFPPELITDPIKAGTSEYGCCDHCGSPYKRLYEQTLVPTNKASFNSQVDDRDLAADANDAGSNRLKDGHKSGHINETVNLGWAQSCKCDNITRVPAVVLDPFFGAGTTGVVARKLGRNFIGIELNETYINDIAIPRLKRELGLFY